MTMRKSIVDFISDEDYPRYNELLDKAEKNKANAPKKPRAKRAPMTYEQKVKRAEKRMLDAEAKVNALLSSQFKP
jgi:hypothetical protein